MLLSVDFSGAHELRAQAVGASVTGRLVPNGASILLSTKPEAPTAPRARTEPVEAALRKDPHAFPYGGEVVLSVSDGRLADVELVVYGVDEPPVFPDLAAFEKPVPNKA
jgi:hypothetical protein